MAPEHEAVARVRSYIESVAPGGELRAAAFDAACRAALRREPGSTTALDRCRNVLLAACLTRTGDVDVEAVDRLAARCLQELLATLDAECAWVLGRVDLVGMDVVAAARRRRCSPAVAEGRLRWARHGIACRLAEATGAAPVAPVADAVPATGGAEVG